MAKPQYNGKWQRIRRLILERDGYRCQIRLEHCRGKATCVDHITATSKGGAWWDPANLRAACTWCNTTRANRERHTPTPTRNWYAPADA